MVISIKGNLSFGGLNLVILRRGHVFSNAEDAILCRSKSRLILTVLSVNYKLSDQDFVNFLKLFDIFGLFDSWSCDQKELMDVFNDYVCFFLPGEKRQKVRQTDGWFSCVLKKYLNRHAKQLTPECMFDIFIQLDNLKLYL